MALIFHAPFISIFNKLITCKVLALIVYYYYIKVLSPRYKILSTNNCITFSLVKSRGKGGKDGKN
ncbi:Uncharacterised protein [[Clostridium] symbiosum]|nr:Uncharacterised protein [[Clostridium] symbiosum]